MLHAGTLTKEVTTEHVFIKCSSSGDVFMELGALVLQVSRLAHSGRFPLGVESWGNG